MIDVHASMVLKNLDSRRIRGITLVVGVGAPESAPGGKGSVSLPSLDVAPGETFPVKIDLNLLRPLQQGSGPLVEVKLDAAEKAMLDKSIDAVKGLLTACKAIDSSLA